MYKRWLSLRGRGERALATIIFVSLAASHQPVEAAPSLNNISTRLSKLDNEVTQLSRTIKRPRSKKRSLSVQNRRLVEAKRAFGAADYDNAAIILFDFVEKYKSHPRYDEAIYYLGESLFQKTDYNAANTYFSRLATQIGSRSKFYQQSLERLIELSLKLDDNSGVQGWMSALEGIPAGKKRESIPYIRGKYFYFSEQYDDAIANFSRIAKGSEHWFQSKYLEGASHIGSGTLSSAMGAYKEILAARANNKGDRRVRHLTHMALGRIYYEQEQPTLAINEYARVPRNSELYDEALYESAWVHVRNKNYDKALRTLELLSMSNPESSRLPDVKILEGNLRIRKAQKLASKRKSNSKEEYARAQKVFDTTRKRYLGPRKTLEALMAEKGDPRQFVAQLTDKQASTFDSKGALPSLTKSWLKEQPDVKQFVSVEEDLKAIREEIAKADSTIARVELAMKNSSTGVFPALAEKKTRALDIHDELLNTRRQLTNMARGTAAKYAAPEEKLEMQRLAAAVAAEEANLKAIPGANLTYGERVTKARSEYRKIEKTAATVRIEIDTTLANLIALEEYVSGEQAAAAKGGADAKQRAEIQQLYTDVREMREELEGIRQDIVLALDVAGRADPQAQKVTAARMALSQALANETNYLQGVLRRANGADKGRADQIFAGLRKATSVQTKVDGVNQSIDEVVEFALADVRAEVAAEKAKIMAYKREFTNYSGESETIGATVLEAGFGAVRKKLSDVLVRTDLGIIDITWAKKESADSNRESMMVERQREVRTLREEFREAFDEEKSSQSDQDEEKSSDEETAGQ